MKTSLESPHGPQTAVICNFGPERGSVSRSAPKLERHCGFIPTGDSMRSCCGSQTRAPGQVYGAAGRRTTRHARAFTLMEVMVAIGLFCVAIFAILELTSRSLRAARGLQHTLVDASSLAAELSLTNKLEEGSESGEFGDRYPNCSWERTITLMSTNGLFKVDFLVSQVIEKRVVASQMSILLYRPDSTVGVGSGNTLRPR